MPTIWGYKLDKHLDEFEDFVRIDKNSRVLRCDGRNWDGWTKGEQDFFPIHPSLKSEFVHT